MGESPRKQNLLDTAGLTHIRAHRDCDRTHRTCTYSNQIKIPALRRGSSHKIPRLSKKLFAIDNCWERKTLIFHRCIAGTSTTVQDRFHAQAKLANTKQTPCFVVFCLVWFGFCVPFALFTLFSHLIDFLYSSS